MNTAIFYCIEMAWRLEHGNMEIHISDHFLKLGEWGRARMWVDVAFQKGNIRDTQFAKKIQQEIIFRLTTSF